MHIRATTPRSMQQNPDGSLCCQTDTATKTLKADRVVHLSVTECVKTATFSWWIDGFSFQNKTMEFFPTTNHCDLFDGKCQVLIGKFQST